MSFFVKKSRFWTKRFKSKKLFPDEKVVHLGLQKTLALQRVMLEIGGCNLNNSNSNPTFISCSCIFSSKKINAMELSLTLVSFTLKKE